VQAHFIIWRWWKELRGEGRKRLGVDGGESTRLGTEMLGFSVLWCQQASGGVIV